MACFAICTAIGARSAILVAKAWAVLITSALGASWLATPQARARSAAQRLTGEDQLLGSSSTDQVAEPTGAAPPGQGANADLRQAKRGVVGEDPQVAGQRQLEPAAVGVAGDGGDGGLPEPARWSNTRCPRRVHCAHMSSGCNALKRLMSAPAQNERSPGSCDEDDPYIPIGVQGDEDLFELPQHLRRQRIVLGRPVEANGGDHVDLDADLADLGVRRFAHVGPSLGSGGVRPRSTWWAPFSPIMVEVAMVLPLINFGMIDASITRRPSIPRTLSS